MKKKTIINSMKRVMFCALLLVTIFSVANVSAQEQKKRMKTDSTSTAKEFRHAINVCPGGIAFGIYSANFEYLIKPNHGLVFRADYEAIPKTYTDANINANGKAFIVNYRYHIGGGLESCYVGAFTRYREYKGNGTLESTNFDFSIPEVTVGLNVGKRWIWKSGFTLNLALGYGHFMDKRKVNHSTPAIESAIDDFQKDYDFFNGFLGEFSIGYAF